MEKKSTSAAVADLIALAASRTGWSIAKLNRHLGKGENTLHRWRAGKMQSFDLEALIEMCRLAGVSLDDAFGAHHTVTHKINQKSASVDSSVLESRVAELEENLQSVKPLVQIVDSFAALIASHMTVARSVEEPSAAVLSSVSDSRILETIDAAQNKAAETHEKAAELERKQTHKKG